jgi:protein-L-isoaspartate(D-aspartate) O-methyltransferase
MLLLASLGAGAQNADRWAESRRRMVETEVVAGGVKDSRVCEAMRATPRHEFVPVAQRANAYFDMALPIGKGQTISSPFIVAYMTEQLEPHPQDRVLEIGTGSGYQAAVLSGLVAEVYSIEIVESLGNKAAETLKKLGYRNVYTKVGDGYKGWPEHAPFDKIIVTCSPDDIPKPLVEQLKEGGRMVVPLGERYQQTLYLYKKVNGVLQREALQPTFFVPMMGRAEEQRIAASDSVSPTLLNGSFEQTAGDQPVGWYYVKQGKVESVQGVPNGAKCLTVSNDTPGRAAHALQAVGIDGRKVHRLEISLWARVTRLPAGQAPFVCPRLTINFFDATRAPAGNSQVGPWSAVGGWSKKTIEIRVPGKARFASVGVGLWGGVGEASFDNVQIKELPAKPADVSGP